ncbi:metallothionein-like protein type 3 [Salvia splendens]|uniref:metallothionein-like protein type 3 n=1 Tax=Salvia splendens TaxID=180675 RepID=UPI001C2617E8|nr:metallothionein-like protein type 3 [Salvia splendens]
MSDKCGSCDCSDKSQCTKQGYAADITETEKSYGMVVDCAEHDGTCKCGSSCGCTDCKCGH